MANRPLAAGMGITLVPLLALLLLATAHVAPFLFTGLLLVASTVSLIIVSAIT